MKSLSSIYILLTFLCTQLNTYAQNWQPLGTGLSSYGYTIFSDTASDLLYVGGNFTSAGGNFSPYIATWDGTSWNPVGAGFNAAVQKIVSFNGDIIASGNFTMSDTSSVYHIAKWNGSSWEAILSGIDDYINDMIVFQNELYIAGGFDTVDGVFAPRLAKWNGSSWSAAGTISGSITKIETVEIYNGNLFFSAWHSGSGNGHRVYQFDGFNLTQIPFNFDMYVYELKTINNVLYAGGKGEWVNTTFLGPYIMTYDGSSWSHSTNLPSNTSSSVTNTVTCLSEYENDLFVGSSPILGTGYTALVKNGNTFSMIDNGVNHQINDAVLYKNYLYVTGVFTSAGSSSSSYISHLYVPPPTANFSASMINLCVNGQVNFTNLSTNNATSYSWFFDGGNPSTSTSLNPSVTYNTVGNYDVKLISTNQYGSDSVIQVNHIQVSSPPNPAIITQNNFTLTSSYPSGNQWYLNGNLLINEINQDLIVTQNGVYTVEYTDLNGCTVLSNSYVITNVAINEYNSSNHIKIFPNPAINKLKLESLNQAIKSVTVFSTNGALLLRHFFESSNGKENFGVSTLGPGLYFVEVKTSSDSYIQKITIIK